MSQKQELHNYISELAIKFNLNWSVTIPFKVVIEGDGRRHVASANHLDRLGGLVNIYSNVLSIEAYGRHNHKRSKEEFIPLIGLAELRKRDGERTLPHFHCLVSFPKGRAEDLIVSTFQFWRERGKTVCGQPIVPHVQPIFDLPGCAAYATKWIDDGYPSVGIITHGIERTFEVYGLA